MIRLNRRTLLKGALGGAAVSVGLPALEAMFNANGNALADGTGLPKRFGIFYWGNGVIPEKWVPQGEKEDWTLSEQMMPLEALKPYLTPISGMAVLTGNTIPHGSGPAGILSGAEMSPRAGPEDFIFSRASIDQIIAEEIGKETRFPSLEMGARPSRGLSYNWSGSQNPPESSPIRLFQRIFNDEFVLPGSEPILNPKVAFRRSVLDAVMNDANRLRGRLSATDKIRLDQHFDGVRALEQRLERLSQNPPSLAACSVPAMPGEDPPDLDGRPQLHEIQSALTDVLRMALACDQTRVFSNYFTYPVNNVLYPGATAGHHQLTHDEPGEQPQVNTIIKMIMTELAFFLTQLKDVSEGDGTLLDSCAILCTSDVSFGRTHTIDNYPVIIAGSGGGELRTNYHHKAVPGDSVGKVSLTLMRAMGLTAATFGAGAGMVNETITEIEL
jgi:hypothetical protein